MLTSFGVKPAVLRTEEEQKVNKLIRKHINWAKTRYHTDRKVVMRQIFSDEVFASDTQDREWHRYFESGMTAPGGPEIVKVAMTWWNGDPENESDGEIQAILTGEGKGEDDATKLKKVDIIFPKNSSTPSGLGTVRMQFDKMGTAIYHESSLISPNALDIKKHELSYFLPPPDVFEYFNDAKFRGRYDIPDQSWSTAKMHHADRLQYPPEPISEKHEFPEN